MEAQVAEARAEAARQKAIAAAARNAGAAEAARYAETIDGLRSRLEEATRAALEQQLLVQERLKMLEITQGVPCLL